MIDMEQKFAALLGKFFQRNNQKIDPLDIEIYVGGLREYGLEKAYQALIEIAKEDGFQRIPTVRRIKEAMGVGEISDRDQGVLISGRIWSAISRYGYMRGTEAREYVGDVGWAVVNMLGGWGPLCENTMIGEQHVFMAQTRDLVQSILIHGKAGDAKVQEMLMPKEQFDAIKFIEETKNNIDQTFFEASKKRGW